MWTSSILYSSSFDYKSMKIWWTHGNLIDELSVYMAIVLNQLCYTNKLKDMLKNRETRVDTGLDNLAKNKKSNYVLLSQSVQLLPVFEIVQPSLFWRNKGVKFKIDLQWFFLLSNSLDKVDINNTFFLQRGKKPLSLSFLLIYFFIIFFFSISPCLTLIFVKKKKCIFE